MENKEGIVLKKHEKKDRKKIVNDKFANDIWEYGKSKYFERRRNISRAFLDMRAYAYTKGQLDECMSRSTFYRRIKHIPNCLPKKRAKPYWMMNKKIKTKEIRSRRLYFFDGILVGMSFKCYWRSLKNVTLLENEKENGR